MNKQCWADKSDLLSFGQSRYSFQTRLTTAFLNIRINSVIRLPEHPGWRLTCASGWLRLGCRLPVAEEDQRGLDHGVFIPFKLVYPEADIPIVQLSLRAGLDPAEHVAAGRALAPLRDENVLIVGTGMSYHNMQRFQRDGNGFDPDSKAFDAWLADTVTASPEKRAERLISWARAPAARAAHPTEEHLMPLHVVAGAAEQDAGRRVFEDRVLGSARSAFMFG